MVGQGVLRECLRDETVTEIVSVGRSSLPQTDPKLINRVVSDLLDLTSCRSDLAAADACFFCLGVSAGFMSEDTYRHLTYDLTLSVARLLAELNPQMTFLYVSGQGTDSTEKGRSMWARVKGATENALLALPFKAYALRPAVIQPMHGIVSKTRSYRALYAVLGPLLPFVRPRFPKLITTTEQVGLAMLYVAKHGWQKRVLENIDIVDMAQQNA